MLPFVGEVLPEIAAAVVAAGRLAVLVWDLGELEVVGGEGIPVELSWFALKNSLREMGCRPHQWRKKNAFIPLHGL